MLSPTPNLALDVREISMRFAGRTVIDRMSFSVVPGPMQDPAATRSAGTNPGAVLAS